MKSILYIMRTIIVIMIILNIVAAIPGSNISAICGWTLCLIYYFYILFLQSELED